MRPRRALVVVVICAIVFGGCAFRKSTLDIGLQPFDTGRGPLSSDAKSARPLVHRAYQGSYGETSMVGALEGTWQRVMNTALLRMVREIASDPALLTVLRERGLTKAAAREP